MEVLDEEFPNITIQKSSRRPTEELKEMDEGYGSMPTIKGGDTPAASPSNITSILTNMAEEASSVEHPHNESSEPKIFLSGYVGKVNDAEPQDKIASIDDDQASENEDLGNQPFQLERIQEEDDEDDEGSIIAPIPTQFFPKKSKSRDAIRPLPRASSPIHRAPLKSLKLDRSNEKHWVLPEEEEEVPEDHGKEDKTSDTSSPTSEKSIPVGPSRLRKWAPVKDLKRACDADEAKLVDQLGKLSALSSVEHDNLKEETGSISSDELHDLDLSSWKAKKLYSATSSTSMTGVLDYYAPDSPAPKTKPIVKSMKLLDTSSLRLKPFSKLANTNAILSYPGALSHHQSPVASSKTPEEDPSALTVFEGDNDIHDKQQHQSKSKKTWFRAKDLLHPIWKRSSKEKQHPSRITAEIKDIESEETMSAKSVDHVGIKNTSTGLAEKRESPGILRRLMTLKEKRNAVAPAEEYQENPVTILKPIEQPVIVDPPEIAAKKPGTRPSTDLDDDDDLLLDYHSRKEKVKFKGAYKLMKNIGSGGHSTVRLARRISDDALVVCKFIHASSVWHWHQEKELPESQRSRQRGPHKIPLEIYMMRAFRDDPHPSIIKYYEHYEIGSRFVIVMEYMGEDWMDLYDYIEYYGPVREDHAADIFYQIVQVVDYMHRHGFCHNDIKDENIMINVKTRKIKLIDLGSTTPLPRGIPTTIFYGTKKFAAPEAVQGMPYYQECQEVWALGTLLYVLLFKMDPFKNDDEVVELDIGSRINRLLTAHYGDSLPTFNLSVDAVDALVRLMHKDWRKRPSLSEILQFKFFKSHNK